ncbi:MAG: FKBP-type peptidyl-prolyl cis-trans isomerase [Desulfobulbaceae bacterium]|nr:FKBP-type peptidyl-prolyl cis-trans isomerase [Desulfobulbaceae bacterium]
MKYLLITFLSLAVLAGTCLANDTLQLQDEKDKISYSVGYQVGGDFKKQGVDLNPAALVKGVQDALAGSGQPLLSSEEMQSILVALKKKIDTALEQEKKKTLEGYRGEGRAFLAENGKKDGVVTLPSGLQYKVLVQGTGKSPTLEDTVTVNYRGTLINGKEFDSSFRDKKPATVRLSTLIPGWQEALPLMKEGGKWQIFVPADLAFGERGPLAEQVVIYEIELLSVQPAS